MDVGMVAGEASGDLLAASLLSAMKGRWPGLHAQGVGGARLAEQGFEAWWPAEKLAVRGYWEVLRHYREIVGIRHTLRERWLSRPPRLFIGVDAPDFNLELELALRGRGIKTVHFVAPAIWAWRAERAELIRRATDRVLCLFPFEPALLQRHGIAATYVGHPLAAVIPALPDRAGARQRLGLGPQDRVVALLPGSRRAEIEHLLPRFLQAARRLLSSQPSLRFVLPAVPALRTRIDDILREARWHEGDQAHALQVLAGDSHGALAACDVTLIASGTATLEAALFKRPMVIAYRMNPLSWWLTRRKMLQPWVGLPNILCEDRVVPEFLQDEATPDALAQAVADWLDQCVPATGAPPGARLQALTTRFADLHERLRRDTATLATDAIEEVLAA